MADRISPPGATRNSGKSVGVIFFKQNGGGQAACWSSGFSGTPREALKRRRKTIWLSNRTGSFLRKNALAPTRGIIHEDGWLGRSWARIIAEWGISASESFDNAASFSRIATVAAGILEETLVQAFGERWAGSPANRRRFLQGRSAKHNLAKALESSLQKSRPRERGFADAARSLQPGEIRFRNRIRRNPSSTVSFHVHWPGFQYAESLASERVPAPGNWSRVKIPDPENTSGGAVLELLSQKDRPVVLMGKFCPKAADLPCWARSWATASGSEALRSAFTLEESKILQEHGEFRILDAYEGSGWLDRAQDSILGRCVDALKTACGGALTARTSWSAGVAAEAFVRSLSYRTAGRPLPVSLEAAWLAAADRMRTVRAIWILQGADCNAASASAGVVEAWTHADPEQLSRIASAVWEAGMILPASAARKFGSLGARLPDIGSEFGGPGTSRLQAAIAIKGAREMMWDLNEALTLPSELRAKATERALERKRD